MSFRRRMDWLHRWGGLVLGALLVVIFFMGTLSVYDREIDRWMMPATRLALPPEPLSLDVLRERIAAVVDPTASWYVLLPDDRSPFVELVGQKAGQPVTRQLDPATGSPLPESHTLGATGFFFPLHYSLMIEFRNVGLFIVAFAGMAMLWLLISGIIIHRGLFKKFFTLRLGPPLRRFSLDLHALTGLAALPFHVGIVVTGLAMFATITMPAAVWALYGDPATFSTEAFQLVSREPTGHAAPSASLDAMVRHARRIWGHGDPFYVNVHNPGDEAAVVEVRRLPTDHFGDEGETIYFDGANGHVLGRATPRGAVHVASVLGGLHLLQVRQDVVRFLYFLAGLAATVMIATGFVIFAEKRRGEGYAAQVADTLAIGSTLGLLLATVAYLLANRLLAGWLGNPTLEILAFITTWAASVVHGYLDREQGPRRTWQRQSLVLAGVCIMAVLSNWLTTNGTILTFLARGQPGVAGVDIALTLTAVAAGLMAARLRRVSHVRDAHPGQL